MLLRMRGIFSVPARSFIGMTTARMGTPLGTSRVFGTARAARVFGTARAARVFGTARTARVFGTVPAARVFGTAWAAVFFAVRFARAFFAARPYRTLRVLVYISFEAVVLMMPEFPVRIAPVARMIAPIIRREPFGMPAMIVAQPSAIRPSPFRMVRVHPIGMVPMPPPVVVIGAFVRSAPTPKRIRFPERRPEPVRVMLVVPPPIRDDANTSTRDYCHATIAHRAKRDARRNRRNAARLRTEPSPAWPSACKLRHTTIANPQLSISCASFLPIAISYAPAFSIEAGQGVGALGETYSEPCLHLQKPVPRRFPRPQK